MNEESNKSPFLISKNWQVIAILLIVSVVGFYQVFFYLNPTKWDMIDVFLPWKHHVATCLQSGHLPIWNPYLYLGSPINADPSSGAWYPTTWIIGYFKGYSVFTIGLELWLHVFLAGVGFYKLSKTLGLSMFFALLAGVCYMLSGLFIGNAQHLPYIISACWLPFVMHYFLRIIYHNQWRDVILGALVLFLSITGGYPAFTIILFYLLLIFFSYYLIKKEKRKGSIQQLVAKNTVMVILALLCSAAMITSFYQVYPYLNRTASFSIESALFSPFSPQSFISLVYPYATAVRINYFDSDLAMRNGYFGLIAFFLFLIGMFRKKPTNIKIIFWFGIFSLAASVGRYLPVREFLFDYVPLMNVFRFPSVFRLFFIIAGILVGLHYLQSIVEDENRSKRPLFIFGLVSFLALAITFHIALNHEAFNLYGYFKENLFSPSASLDFWKNIAVQGIFQLCVIISFLIILWKVKRKVLFQFLLLLLVTFDMVVATQLNAASTVYSHEWSGAESDAIIKDLPQGFLLPEDITILESEKKAWLPQQFWRNTGVLTRKVVSTGFNSFNLTRYEKLQNERILFYNELKNNKLLLLSDTLLSGKTFSADSAYSSEYLFLNQNDYNELSKKAMSHSGKDTAKLVDFGSFFFTAKTITKEPQMLTLFQQNYPGWTVKVNGVETKIITSNENFISIYLPKGVNKVFFEYKNKLVSIAFWIAVMTLLIMATYLLIDFRNKRINKE
ncbi:MAG TPA: hypothetical protein EYG86_04350 [Crocinitomicaceae bacterium]|nr:hypothetical protein [Crocinitomicaceae bacterium]